MSTLGCPDAELCTTCPLCSALSLVSRPLFLLPVLVAVVGFVCVPTIDTLIGLFLIIGGVAALGVTALPASIDWVAGFLSTGVGRRR